MTVNVTGCPTTDGFEVDVRAAVVGLFWTVWDKTADVLEASGGFPE
jgi:hypothetical protein